jgi:hypothetical protein
MQLIYAYLTNQAYVGACIYESICIHIPLFAYIYVQETYRDALVTYSQELTGQIQEANEFFMNMQAHIDSIAPGVHA